MAKESLVVHEWKLLFKKYMKNHKIKFFLNKVERKKITKEELILLLSLKKKKIRVCTAFIVFMVNLSNLEINYQCLSLSFKFNLLEK